MNHIRPVVAAVALLTVGPACSTTTERLDLPPLEAVKTVDLERYMGRWYEIASYPQRFQEGCTGTTATYALKKDGEVLVVNRCFKGSLDGKESVAEGRARLKEKGGMTSKLEVSFFGPFWGDYWVIDLGDDYDYAVVGHPGRDYLWILSRTPQMDPDRFRGVLDRLKAKHYDLDRLQTTAQPMLQTAT
jgi:apolipoprotein D and lipocalin family protein